LGTHRRLNHTAKHIANSIVKLVKRIGGPVTLAQIASEIPGFSREEPPAWSYIVTHAGGELLVWDCMTKEGYSALRNVMSGRRVAVQFVSSLPYFLENSLLGSENWKPIVLLPKSAGNLETPLWLLRASPGYREYSMARAAKERIAGYRKITACPVRFTADQFSP
jgi:hypothetical protein